MPKFTSTASLALVVSLAASLAIGGCGEQDSAAASPEIIKLRTDLKESQRRHAQVIDRLDKFERRLDGMTQDIDRLSHQRVKADLASATAAVDTDETGAAASMGDPTAPAAPDELIELLQSEQGQELVAGAMKALEARRDEERRERMVGAMVDRFAEMANLTPQQNGDVTRIVGDSFRKMGDVWSSMRDAGDLTAEERTAARDENMVKMEEIRQATNDEMKAVLNSEQYAIYEEQANRMRGFGGGGTRRGGGGFGR